MKTAYVVQHSYEAGAREETKLIGVYSSPTAAAQAVERLKKQPGFCDRPDDFSVDEFEIDRDNWEEGFARLMVVLVPRTGSQAPVGAVAEVLADGTFRLEEKIPGDGSPLFHGGQVVRCRPVSSDDPRLIAYEQV